MSRISLYDVRRNGEHVLPKKGKEDLVKVAVFRDRIDALHGLLQKHRSCRTLKDRRAWERAFRNAGSELARTVCERGDWQDWYRRERALERCALVLGRYRLGGFLRAWGAD